MHTILFMISLFFYLIALSIFYVDMKDLRLIENTNEIIHHFVKVFQFVTNRGVINGNDQ